MVSVFALVCVIPLSLLSYFTIHLADRAVIHQVNDGLQTTSAVTAILLQEQLRSVTQLASSYATRPVLINALGDGNAANFRDAAVTGQLAQLRASRPGIGGAFLADLHCRVTQVVPSTPAIIGKDFGFRDWCKGVKSTDAAYVSEAYQTAILGQPLVVAAAVVVRSEGGASASKPLAILTVVYTLDAIRAFAHEVSTVQGVRLTVTDQRGTVLVARSAAADPDALISAAQDPRVRAALGGRSGVTRSSTTDGDALSAYSPVGAIGWTVTAEAPASEALAGVRELRSTVLSIAGFLGLMLMLGSVQLARTLRQRRDSERALLERDAQTRAILDAATDAFVSMDAAGTISAWNAQAQALFGWTEAEAIGRTLAETVIPPDQRRQHERGMAHFLATGDGPILNQRIEVTALRRDGRQFLAELAVWPVRSSDSWSFNAFIRDISDRKRAEADLARARDEALQASQLKSEFLANMSHEIRTPMNGVLGMTSLLLDTQLGDEQREFAETVLASGESLLSILNDILDFSKIEAGRLDLECVDFDLRGLTENVASLLSLPAHGKGLELVCSLPDDMPAVVRGDPGRLRQILTNLVGNAVKFTASGEVLLEVRIVDSDDPGVTMARFRVVDTGIGISRSDHAAVFESFSQADAATTRRYGGTGLGLAISRQLVELMGGQIGVQSELGQGSTFWFTVPLQRGELPREPEPAASLAGMRMLVVDDNATNRAVLTRFLDAWGIRSEAADGSRSALAVLTAAAATGDPFDAALLDLNMPDMDGIELARCIAADPAVPTIKLLLLTSSGQRGETEQAKAAGITAYLTKPVHRGQLYDRLTNIMQANSTPAGRDISVPRPRIAADGQAGRILLAEDNMINQRVAATMLRNLGYEVDVVANGAEAVQAAQQAAYDVILMDCQMPVLDGYGATVEIRRLETGSRRTPVIAVTASAMKSDEERCRAAGMDDYLAKPISVASLTAVLTRCFAPTGTNPPHL